MNKLEKKREFLHNYIIIKLEEHDYHAVADAAMDLRELEVQVKLLNNERSKLTDDDVSKDKS